MKLLLLFPLFFLSQNIFACSCIPQGKIDDEQYNHYCLIAEGKIIKISVIGWEKVIILRVAAYYKGAWGLREIKIYTASDEGMCGITPAVGEKWLIYATGSPGKLSVSLCSRTMNMSPGSSTYQKEVLENDIDYLIRKAKLK